MMTSELTTQLAGERIKNTLAVQIFFMRFQAFQPLNLPEQL